MPLELEEEYRVYKIANKIVNMIEASGGEVFQSGGFYTALCDSDSDSNETHCLQLYDWDNVGLAYPESKLDIDIEIYYNCACRRGGDCDCRHWIEIVVTDLHSGDELINEVINDLATYDYSDIINKIIDLMNSKK